MSELTIFDVPDTRTSKENYNLINEFVEKYKQLNKSLLENETKNNNIIQKAIDYIVKLNKGLPPIEQIEEILKYFSSIKNEIIKKELPDLMTEAGLSSMVLDNGIKLILDQFISIIVKDKNSFLNWIQNKGYGAEIKNNFELAKGENIEKIIEFLRLNGYSFKHNEDIHYKTKERIIKEVLNSGENLPDKNIADVYIGNIVKIK